jgi:bifunctional pyridoxal-dependent enzyme with beta-cystathionase and maltose regulon repressor activities
MAVSALTKPGEGVVIMPPVYHPFFEAVEKTGRRVIANG